MRRILRMMIAVIVLSLVAIGGIEYAGWQSSALAEGPTIEDETDVTAGDLTVTVSATGAIMPARQVSLAFELSAPVREVLVREGQTVKAGDVLARLEANDLEMALNNAQITLAGQQASYDALVAPPRDVDIAVAEANLKAAQAQAGAASLGPDANNVEIARLQAEIARNQLWQAQLGRDLLGGSPDNVTGKIKEAENNVALSDVSVEGAANQGADVASLSSANAQIVSAQVQLDRLKNGPSELDLQIGQTQLQMAQLAVEQAQANLNRAELIAPFDGVIARSNLVVGEIPPHDAVMQLIDSSGFYVDVEVDETDIVNVQAGQPVNLSFDALPDAKITGKVSRIAVVPNQTGQLVTFTVRVTLDPTDEPVRSSMTATATIITNELHHVLTLPNRFIRIDRETQQAYVTVERANNQYEDVPVTLGVRNETQSQIVSGLTAGERVVLLPREAFNPIG